MKRVLNIGKKQGEEVKPNKPMSTDCPPEPEDDSDIEFDQAIDQVLNEQYAETIRDIIVCESHCSIECVSSIFFKTHIHVHRTHHNIDDDNVIHSMICLYMYICICIYTCMSDMLYPNVFLVC